MNKSQFYLRIFSNEEKRFIEHMDRNGISYMELSRDTNGTLLYSMRMSAEEAMSLRISFQTAGFLNFTKALSKKGKPVEVPVK